jgi:ankyrin repeat protein
VLWFLTEQPTITALLSFPSFDLRYKDPRGRGLLHLACEANQRLAVKVLLRSERLDSIEPDNDGITPFELACQIGAKNTTEVLVELLRDEYILKAFITKPSADLGWKDSRGNTLLHLACRFAIHHTAILLVSDDRVKPSTPNAEGKTPLQIACAAGHNVMVGVLLASGRDIGARSGKALASLIQTAKKAGHQDVAALLTRFEKEPRKVVRELRKTRFPGMGIHTLRF